MSNIVLSNAIESALVEGDLSKLNANERLSFYKNQCESMGLNPLTKPFAYIRFQKTGKLALYATKDCTDQLRKLHEISIHKLEKEIIGDTYVVTAYARGKDGKEDSDMGAVDIAGLSGEGLANAMMKASTKAKRRVTLSICGLGILDETEIETIADAQKVPEPSEKQLKVAAPSDAGEDPGAYVCTFGKYKGERIDEIDQFDLSQYVAYIYKSAKEKGETLRNGVLMFVETAEAYLKTKEFERNR